MRHDARWIIVTPPTTEPLTTAEAKAHLDVTGSQDDTLIDDIVAAAREWIEGETNRALITQTWDLFLDEFPSSSSAIIIPWPPLVSVTTVKYTPDVDSSPTTFSATKYIVDSVSEPARIVLEKDEVWPTDSLKSVNGVEVRFVAGYGAASAVPKRLKHLTRLLVGHWYNNPDAVVTGSITKEIELAVQSLSWGGRTFYGSP